MVAFEHIHFSDAESLFYDKVFQSIAKNGSASGDLLRELLCSSGLDNESLAHVRDFSFHFRSDFAFYFLACKFPSLIEQRLFHYFFPLKSFRFILLTISLRSLSLSFFSPHFWP
jgi:hypothetical protein